MSSPPPQYKHFKGKSAIEHVKEARLHGAKATEEIHGVEPPGAITAGADSAKEMAILLTGFWILLSHFALSLSQITLILTLFSSGWLLWRVGRSTLLGWARLERLHRLIAQERWEIQHKRAQEKEELRTMYQQKGFRGQLLEKVVEVLMADDNRLLWIMLEEELGLTLKSYEHPLKQGVGAAIGIIVAFGIGTIGIFLGSFLGLSIAMSLTVIGASILPAKWAGNDWIKHLIWTVSIALFSIGMIYLLTRL